MKHFLEHLLATVFVPLYFNTSQSILGVSDIKWTMAQDELKHPSTVF